MADKKGYDNHLGIIGWVLGGRWGIERYLYIIHRITGLGLLIFFLLHIFESSLRIFGAQTWTRTMEIMEHPVFKVGEFLVIICFAFHALNGIRLILLELGVAVGKAEEPVYPYRSSLNTQRPLMLVVMVVCAIFIVIGGYDLFFLGD
jgi:succinate dehydrogenase / fumarate reductase cytochrome b subunit